MAFTGRKHGTQSRTFWMGLGGILGKFKFLVTEGTHDATLTITNNPLTANREIKFPDADGTIITFTEVAEFPVGPVDILTHTAPVTADTELQDLTDTGGYGFKTKDEGNTVLGVIVNLQQRVAQLESYLSAGNLASFPEDTVIPEQPEEPEN